MEIEQDYDSESQHEDEDDKKGMELSQYISLFQMQPFESQIKSQKTNNLPIFPLNVWSNILFRCDIPSLLSLSRVCKDLSQICSDDNLWRPLVMVPIVNQWSREEIPHLYQNMDLRCNNGSWKNVAKELGLTGTLIATEAIKFILDRRNMMMSYLRGMLLEKDGVKYTLEKLTDTSAILKYGNKKDQGSDSIIECDGKGFYSPLLDEGMMAKVVGACPPGTGSLGQFMGKVGKVVGISYSCGWDTTAAVIKFPEAITICPVCMLIPVAQ